MTTSELLFRIITIALTAISVTAAVYNVLTARSTRNDEQQKAKLDTTAELAKRNEQDIKNLKERMEACDERTEKRLDQIGNDVAEVKKLFTNFLIDTLRAARP
ncbi:hypothetical protein [Hymenobacter sp. BT190]|uniref:hypothetical protein n=1 Tax=Hymenobacter sp. BT190 TaxID=2763505 RepID=UPI0016517167|nr:hypothetical protein [Hymenobacter sp. BT190]MBC6698083.1 hypothetical protein [Hymenobacter sp. BT190]